MIKQITAVLTMIALYAFSAATIQANPSNKKALLTDDDKVVLYTLTASPSASQAYGHVNNTPKDPVALFYIGDGRLPSSEAFRLAYEAEKYCLRFGYTPSVRYHSIEEIHLLDSTWRVVVIIEDSSVNLDSLEALLIVGGVGGAYIFYDGEVSQDFSAGDANAVTDWFCVYNKVVSINLPFATAASLLSEDAGRPKDLRLEAERAGGQVRFATIR